MDTSTSTTPDGKYSDVGSPVNDPSKIPSELITVIPNDSQPVFSSASYSLLSNPNNPDNIVTRTGDEIDGGRKSRKFRKSRKSRKSRKFRKSRKSKKSRKSRK